MQRQHFISKKAISTNAFYTDLNKIQKLTASPDSNPTGFMNIGEDYKNIAPDLTKYVVEFAFSGIYSRPGLEPWLLRENHKLVCTLKRG